MHIWLSFGWWDLLDILVVSVLMHRLLLLLRGTTALQVILGLGFLWLGEALARAGDLILTSWFLRGIGAVAVLVIVVVFRNELRELFVRTNPLRFLLGRDPSLSKFELAPVVESVFRLAVRNTGALIVLQGKDPLGAYLREGTDWDSKVGSRIIETIFAKESPVHDGAIIIRGNRITRAATFLPLTQKEGLPQHYGTRHRAALGLGETSDAVILVVSEERGEVSLIHGNSINVMANQEMLEETLESVFAGDRTVEKRFFRPAWISYAAGLLLTFLVVSTVWGIYVGRQLSLVSVSTAIDFRNVPENVVLRSVSADEVEVQVSGKQILVSNLNRAEVRGFLDLDALESGTHQLILNRQNIEVPMGLEVVRVQPSTVEVELEQRIEKSIPVKPRLVGVPATQIHIEMISPESVRLNGPESTLKGMSQLFTQQIDLSDTDISGENLIVEAPLAISPPSLQLAEGEPDTVRLRIGFPSREAPGEEERFYQIHAGDTLWEISRRHGLTVQQLLEMNNLEAKAPIHPGQTIKLGPRRKD
jgi:uncharacterized protein (TIGR00159 family)